MARLGITLSFLDLAVNFRLDVLSLLFSIRLGDLAFALHGLVGGLLRLGDPALDVPTRLAFDLPHAGATALTYPSSVVGAILGLLRGLHGPVLGLPSTLAGVLGAFYPDVD